MPDKKIPYYQLRSIVEVMILKVFEDQTVSGGWTVDEFLEAYGAELASRLEEETYDIAISAPTMLQ